MTLPNRMRQARDLCVRINKTLLRDVARAWCEAVQHAYVRSEQADTRGARAVCAAAMQAWRRVCAWRSFISFKQIGRNAQTAGVVMGLGRRSRLAWPS